MKTSSNAWGEAKNGRGSSGNLAVTSSQIAKTTASSDQPRAGAADAFWRRDRSTPRGNDEHSEDAANRRHDVGQQAVRSKSSMSGIKAVMAAAASHVAAAVTKTAPPLAGGGKGEGAVLATPCLTALPRSPLPQGEGEIADQQS